MSFILLYGPGGSGKTTLACSMTRLGYKVNLKDIDQKANRMVNIANLIKDGKVIVEEVDERLTEVTMRQRITSSALTIAKQPKGYLKICDMLGVHEEELSKGIKRENEVLVIDSLTAFCEHLKRMISYIQKKEKFGFDEWAIYAGNLEDFFYLLMNLQKVFKHIIVIAHDQMDKDEDTGRVVKVTPAIQGATKNTIFRYFEEVYYTTVQTKLGKPIFQVFTKPMNKADARTSRDLDVLVDADFSILFKEEKKNG